MFNLKDNLVSKNIRKYRSIIFRTYVILATVAFGFLAYTAKQTPYFGIDLILANAIQNFNPTWFDILMKVASVPGNPPGMLAIIGGTVIYTFISKFKWESVCFTVAGILVLFFENFFKNIIQRSRPEATLVKVFLPIHSYSFPSGHVLSYVVYFGFLIFLIFTLFPLSKTRTLLMLIPATLVTFVGLSRVYLGEHWPSDVLGAYLIGSALLLFIIELYIWGRSRFFKKDPTVTPKEI